MKDRYEARKVIIKVEIPRRSINEKFPYPGLRQLFGGKSPEGPSPSSSILALYLCHEPVQLIDIFPTLRHNVSSASTYLNNNRTTNMVDIDVEDENNMANPDS